MTTQLPFRVRLLLVLVAALATVSRGGLATAAETQEVTLKNGKIYHVPTDHGLPVSFRSREMRVQDLGVTARIEETSDTIPWLWLLRGELKAKGHFLVTVTTPMDEKVSTTFEITGPGQVQARFFPQAAYPTVWDGADDPGIHWFPFEFSFEDRATGKSFKFTQWAQLNSRDREELRAQIEEAKAQMRELRKKQQEKQPDRP